MGRRFKKTCLVVVSFLLAQAAFSQSKAVSGTVRDEKGIAMPGVEILEKGTQNGVVSDFDGHFKIQVSGPEAVLQFSYLGYETLEQKVGARSTFDDLRMTEQHEQLEELVVVGYGKQRKESVTGAVSTVKLGETANRPITDASQALMGQVPGIFVTQQSGAPGITGATIRVRGVGTLGNSNALVVIDGVPGDFSSVNVNDIASISVLKDAASAAIYGSRAANGVILITTKTGGKGVVYEGYGGIQAPTRSRDFITSSAEYAEQRNIAARNLSPNGQLPFSQDQIEDFRLNGPNTDWQRLVYSKAALITNHNIRVRGGSDKVKYNASFNYIKQDGVVRGTSADAFNGRINLEGRISKKLSFDIRAFGSTGSTKNPIGGVGTLIGWVDRTPPTDIPFIEVNGKQEYFNTFLSRNPEVLINEGDNSGKWNALQINSRLMYEFIPGLKLTALAGIATSNDYERRQYPKVTLYDRNLNPNAASVSGVALSLYNSSSLSRYVNLSSFLTYDKTFGGVHEVSALLGVNQEVTRAENFNATKLDLPNNELTVLTAAGGTATAGGGASKSAIQSGFGRLKYGFDKRYYIEGSFRYDGSVNFAEPKRWGFFPSIGGVWNVSEEPFFKKLNIPVNALKFRGSYGELGNQAIGQNRFLDIYDTANNGYVWGSTIVGGIGRTIIGNPDISWEVSKTYDVALDFGLWGNRLTGSIDYYYRKTDGILRQLSISRLVGNLPGPQQNLAQVSNQGYEFLLTYSNAGHVKQPGGFTYTVSGNFTINDNRVESIPARQIEDRSWLEAGHSINEFYLIKKIGIFQTDEEARAYVGPDGVTPIQPNAKAGDVKFADLGGSSTDPNVAAGPPDGKIDQFDRVPAGNSFPKYAYGLNLNFSYKNFDLALIFQGLAGFKVWTEYEQMPFFNDANMPRYWIDAAWTPENGSTQWPKLIPSSSRNPNNNWRNDSTLWLQDGAFLRLRNIQLGYTFPDKFIPKKTGITGLRVYVNAQNPLTITNYRGLDPEKDVFSGRGNYTNVQIWSAGLRINLF